MRELSGILKTTYDATSIALVPGSGSFGMEAVARQFATGQKCLVIRYGWFSYRWSQILETGEIASGIQALKARKVSGASPAPFASAPVDEVVAAIRAEAPAVVFAPHVETACGMVLPPDYLKAVADAVHAAGGLFVLDCIASGALWVDMAEIGVDVLISVPQKGWSGSPCCAFVMLGATARERIETTASTSFACDLRKWLQVMEAYEGGGHAYHATLPTDAIARTLEAMEETRRHGLQAMRQAQKSLGTRVGALLEGHGFPSVAAPDFQAPDVVVSYTDDPEIQSSRKFAALGLQTAAGVPLQCDEPADYCSFRIGLFGLDKLPGGYRALGRALRRLAR